MVKFLRISRLNSGEFVLVCCIIDLTNGARPISPKAAETELENSPLQPNEKTETQRHFDFTTAVTSIILGVNC